MDITDNAADETVFPARTKPDRSPFRPGREKINGTNRSRPLRLGMHRIFRFGG